MKGGEEEIRIQTNAEGRPQETQEKAIICEPKAEASEEAGPTGSLILSF